MHPRFSVAIPARNEEKFIAVCLESVKRASKEIEGQTEIIVVLNRCTDRTEEIALSFGARIERNDSKNLASIRNSGCHAAKGDIIVTVDADSRISPNMLSVIEASLSSGKVVGGGVLIIPERWSVGILVTALMLLPIALCHRISGGLFFCFRKDFLAIKGFNEQLCSVEDIDFAVRLKAHGRKSGRKFKVLLHAHIVTSCRKFDHFGDWYMVLHPGEFLTLLRGRNQKLADKVWYDFKR